MSTTTAAQAREDIARQFEEAGDTLDRIPVGVLDVYCALIADVRDAQARIETEGETLIVADAKGAPSPHPAVEVLTRCSRELRDLAPLVTPKRRMTR